MNHELTEPILPKKLLSLNASLSIACKSIIASNKQRERKKNEGKPMSAPRASSLLKPIIQMQTLAWTYMLAIKNYDHMTTMDRNIIGWNKHIYCQIAFSL